MFNDCLDTRWLSWWPTETGDNTDCPHLKRFIWKPDNTGGFTTDPKN